MARPARVWMAAAWITAALLVSAASGAWAQGTSGGVVALVLKVKSDVTQRPNDSAEWQPAVRGQALVAGHQIRTGPDGFCAVIFRDDKSLLKVNASSEVKLNVEPAAGGKFTKKLWVQLGGVWAQVAKQEGSEFTIETPTSVASVKGTAGYDMVDASGYTTLYGTEGNWDFSNPFGSVAVGQGFQAFSNGIDPPKLNQTPPGAAPTFGNESVPGVTPPQGGGGGNQGTQELRIGMRETDGTGRTLIIRYREANPPEQH